MITDILAEKVTAAFKAAGYDITANVTLSDRPDLCQFQCNNAFAAAKAYRKAPFIVAEETAKVLSADPMFKSVEGVKPGFVNITLTDEAIAAFADEIAVYPVETVGQLLRHLKGEEAIAPSPAPSPSRDSAEAESVRSECLLFALTERRGLGS